MRQRWRRHQGQVDPDRLVFVDETWAKTNMTGTHGWAMRGQRLVAAVPALRETTMTLVAALRTRGITAPCVFDGPIDACLFQAWAEQCLVPTLRPGDLDNLDSHKGLACAVPCATPAHTCCSCRPTAPTSTRSR